MPEADNLLAGDSTTPDGGDAAAAAAAAAAETPEAKAAAEAAAAETPEAKAAREAEAKANEVPEKYDFKMPEDVELDATAVEDFSAIAKELKLPQAAAQRVVEVGVKMAQRQREQYQKTVASWTEEIRKDPDIGGDKLDESVAIGRQALATFGSPELKDVLLSTGLGNHPAMVRAFYKIGKAIAPDGFLKGGTTTQTERDPARSMYPSMFPK